MKQGKREPNHNDNPVSGADRPAQARRSQATLQNLEQLGQLFGAYSSRHSRVNHGTGSLSYWTP